MRRLQYELALTAEPSDGDVLFALAHIAMEQERLTDAQHYFEQMVRWNRRVGEARYYLGSISEKQGQTEAAIKQYRQVGRGYEFLPAQGRIAALMVEQGRIEEMHEHLSNMRADSPQRANQLYMVEAQALTERGMADRVFKVLDEAVAADPDNTELLYYRAMTGAEFNRLDVLETDLVRLLEIEPDNADALNALGYTLADLTDRYEEALHLIERALALKPNEAAFIDSLGWVQYRLKNYQPSIENLRKALSMFPNDEVAAHLGEVLWTVGQHDEARSVWNKALDDKPDSDILKRVIERFTGVK